MLLLPDFSSFHFKLSQVTRTAYLAPLSFIPQTFSRLSALSQGWAKTHKLLYQPRTDDAQVVPMHACMLSRFSCVRLCATPETAAHQAPWPLGFSRLEYWSGLPFPSPLHESEKWKWSRSVVSNSSRPHGLQPTRLLRPWDFPGKSTAVGCHCLLPGCTKNSLEKGIPQTSMQTVVTRPEHPAGSFPMGRFAVQSFALFLALLISWVVNFVIVGTTFSRRFHIKCEKPAHSKYSINVCCTKILLKIFRIVNTCWLPCRI